jgi:ABC-type dipeptide/oligopeptide/nickel transport system ATPase component
MKEVPPVNPSATDPILSFDHYSAHFVSASGPAVPVLEDVTFSVRRGALTAIVGETGSGKTMTALAVLGLTPTAFRRTAGEIRFEGEDLAGFDETALRRVRGSRIAMVFQDSRSALNPVFTIGTQLMDVCRLHHRIGRKEARAMAEHLLERVRVPEPARRMRQYPHQLSGGTVQRIQLALGLACRPALLLMDEPTTGLDVTIQADILELIVELTRTESMSTCIITHDLGVVAETCHEVVVMRAGQIRETGSVEQIMTRPQDSYTQELLASSRIELGAA